MDYNDLTIFKYNNAFFTYDHNNCIEIRTRRIVDKQESKRITVDGRHLSSYDVPNEYRELLTIKPIEFWYDPIRGEHQKIFIKYLNGGIYYSVDIDSWVALRKGGRREIKIYSQNSYSAYKLNKASSVHVCSWINIPSSSRKALQNKQPWTNAYSFNYTYKSHKDKKPKVISASVVHIINGCDNSYDATNINWSNCTCPDCLKIGYKRHPINTYILQAAEAIGLDLGLEKEVSNVVHCEDQWGAIWCDAEENSETLYTDEWDECTCPDCLIRGYGNDFYDDDIEEAAEAIGLDLHTKKKKKSKPDNGKIHAEQTSRETWCSRNMEDVKECVGEWPKVTCEECLNVGIAEYHNPTEIRNRLKKLEELEKAKEIEEVKFLEEIVHARGGHQNGRYWCGENQGYESSAWYDVTCIECLHEGIKWEPDNEAVKNKLKELEEKPEEQPEMFKQLTHADGMGDRDYWCDTLKDANTKSTGMWSGASCIECLQAGLADHPGSDVIKQRLKELGQPIPKPQKEEEKDKIIQDKFIHMDDPNNYNQVWCGLGNRKHENKATCWLDVNCPTCLRVGLENEDDPDELDDIRFQISNLNIKTKEQNPKNKPQKGVEKMKNTVQDSLVRAGTRNKEAATKMSKVKLGQIANSKITKLVIAKAPFGTKGMLKEYPELVTLLAANIISLGADQYAPSNRKLRVVADCMLDAAYASALDFLKLEERLDDLLKMIPADLLTSVMDEDEDED